MLILELKSCQDFSFAACSAAAMTALKIHGSLDMLALGLLVLRGRVADCVLVLARSFLAAFECSFRSSSKIAQQK
jgi:hypothetical protein